jgi:hypothetical protein
VTAFWKGDVDGARQANARLQESWTFQTGELTPNPIPSKAMLRSLGLPAGQCRLPLGPAPDGLEDRARDVYARLHGPSGASGAGRAESVASEAGRAESVASAAGRAGAQAGHLG